MTPDDLQKLFFVWLFCVVNFDVLNTVVQPGFDFTSIAAKIGADPGFVSAVVSSAAQLNKEDFKNLTPLEATAKIFSSVALQSGYVPVGGHVCGSVAELLAAV
jgi:hypothetical protein